MQSRLYRVVAALGIALATVALTAVPANAATTNVAITWDGFNGSTLGVSPSSLTINSGDSVRLNYTGAGGASSLLYGIGTNCSINSIGQIPTGGSDIVSPTTTTTYAFQAGNNTSSAFSACGTLTVNVNTNTPPPDVPEAPYTAGLLGAAVVLFGGGFFILRRRRARVA
jgi:hypothetical protein